MSYTISAFTNWVADFQTWEALRTWLTSAEGGSLRVIEPKEGDYAVVRYVKGQSDFEKAHVRWCRSVVVQKSTRLPVCVAPPKANELTEASVNEADVAEEFVDGTMINVYATTGSAPQLATRSRLGAKAKFYNDGLSFEEMSREAMAANGVTDLADVLPQNADTASCFTSTVLQHPRNRIVGKVERPTFYIVHQGWTFPDGRVEITEDATDFRCITTVEGDAADFFEIPSYNLEAVRAAKTVKDWVAKQSQDRGHNWQGVVLKDGNGNRWRVRSDIYETVRRIRGNESTVAERFARLRKTRTLDNYLVFYPEDRDAFYELEGRLRKNSRQLSHFYNDTFRSRTTPFHELPWPYKHHVSVLHNLFKDVLRAQGKKVDLEQVIRYVNGLNLEDLVNMTKTHKLDLVKKDVKVEKPAAADADATPAPEPVADA
jgi:hypothetical protein